jgi:hypothetical protein
MPAQLRFKPGAIGQYFDGPMWSGKLVETHSSACHHCQKLTEFPSMKRMMDYVDICRGCMKLICLECHGKPCRPFEAEAERQEQMAEIQRRVQLNAWRCY